MRDVRHYVLPLLACTFAVLSVLVVHQRVDRFLTEDPRFAIRKAEYGEMHSPDLIITGANRTSIAAVRMVFAADEGKSVYLIPIAERQRKLTNGIDWVKSASVQRLWPNRLQVRIEERKPVLLVNLAPERCGAAVRLRAIDDDGRILPAVGVPELAGFPVMAGVKASLGSEELARRVRLMMRVIQELGAEGRPVSEIDVGDPDSIKLIYPIAGRSSAVTLLIGDSRWRPRLLKFLRNWHEVDKWMPNAAKLDLRDEAIIGAKAGEGPCVD
jgi:hypothetical protein